MFEATKATESAESRASSVALVIYMIGGHYEPISLSVVGPSDLVSGLVQFWP